jgi:hypothetical protein
MQGFRFGVMGVYLFLKKRAAIGTQPFKMSLRVSAVLEPRHD